LSACSVLQHIKGFGSDFRALKFNNHLRTNSRLQVFEIDKFLCVSAVNSISPGAHGAPYVNIFNTVFFRGFRGHYSFHVFLFTSHVSLIT